MKRIASTLLLLTSAACATGAGAGGSAAACDAAPAQGLVGREGTSALAAEAQRLSGAGTVRWLQPGQIVTMEYRFDRLNIKLDAGGRVEGITCG